MSQKLAPGRTVYTIDTAALTHNLNWYIQKLNQETGVIIVLKDRAYGSGLEEVAKHFAGHPRLSYFAVARTFEGVRLREAGIKERIIVLNPSLDSISDIYSNCLEPEVYNIELLQAIAEELDGRPMKIHLKMDSGMHRLGIFNRDLPKVTELLKKHQNISIDTCLSHLTASSDPNHDSFTNQQLQTFLEGASELESLLNMPFKKHIANTGAISRHKNTHLDFVRIGIGLYGLGGNGSELKNVCSLRSAIADIKWVPKGATASYNRSFRAEKDTRIASLFIGYSDGLNRHLGNGSWYVKVKGQKAPIIGDICMDICLIDITDIDAELGDEAVFFESIEEIQAMSKILETIPYEILTTLDQGIERRYLS